MLALMQLSDVFLQLGEDRFQQLLRGVSIGKLKTYQLYDRFKLRMHLPKLNGEILKKSSPRLYARLNEHDEEFATDLSQAVLVSHLDMIVDVLNFLGIPHEDGFFAKDLSATEYLTEGWQERVYQNFRGKYSGALLTFYINHLALELTKADQAFLPAA